MSKILKINKTSGKLSDDDDDDEVNADDGYCCNKFV